MTASQRRPQPRFKMTAAGNEYNRCQSRRAQPPLNPNPRFTQLNPGLADDGLHDRQRVRSRLALDPTSTASSSSSQPEIRAIGPTPRDRGDCIDSRLTAGWGNRLRVTHTSRRGRPARQCGRFCQKPKSCPLASNCTNVFPSRIRKPDAEPPTERNGNRQRGPVANGARGRRRSTTPSRVRPPPSDHPGGQPPLRTRSPASTDTTTTETRPARNRRTARSGSFRLAASSTVCMTLRSDCTPRAGHSERSIGSCKLSTFLLRPRRPRSDTDRPDSSPVSSEAIDRSVCPKQKFSPSDRDVLHRTDTNVVADLQRVHEHGCRLDSSSLTRWRAPVFDFATNKSTALAARCC